MTVSNGWTPHWPVVCRGPDGKPLSLPIVHDGSDGLAAASVAFAILIFVVSRPEMDHQLQPMLEDLDVMTSTESADLSEDLEFYDWLADSSTAG
jgi:hypothetical protein